jgi:hypothetical protein
LEAQQAVVTWKHSSNHIEVVVINKILRGIKGTPATRIADNKSETHVVFMP